ncbi:MAG TPA: hypothetical protein DIW30_06470 [Bacteroidales bacterium]|nr:hypothetical protein [Bacteroidales bacterium]
MFETFNGERKISPTLPKKGLISSLFKFVAFPFRDASGVVEVGLRGRGDILPAPACQRLCKENHGKLLINWRLLCIKIQVTFSKDMK